MWFISPKVFKRFRLLCQVLQRDRGVFRPPFAKRATNGLIDALDEEGLEHLLGIHRPAR